MSSGDVTDVTALPDSPVMVAAAAPVAAPAALSTDQESLVKLVTGVFSKKPTSKAEALEMFHSLQVKLGTWLVSELPAMEAKAVLLGLWAADAVQAVDFKSCFGKK